MLLIDNFLANISAVPIFLAVQATNKVNHYFYATPKSPMKYNSIKAASHKNNNNT